MQIRNKAIALLVLLALSSSALADGIVSAGGGASVSGALTAGDLIAGGPAATQIQDTSSLVSSPGYATLPVGLNVARSIAVSGANGPASSGIYWTGAVSGTCTGAGQPCYANNIIANPFAVKWSVGQTPAVVTGNLNVSTVFGGTNQIGGFVNFNSSLNMTAATGNTANAFYVSANFAAQTNINDGGAGTGASARGSLFAANPQVQCLSGATFYVECSSVEDDAAIAAGASANLQYIHKAILLSNNAVAASSDSGGYILGIQSSGTNTLACGYCYGQNGGDHGIASTGMLFGATHTGVSAVAAGINLTNFPAFTNAMIIGPSGGTANIQTGSNQNFTVLDGANGAKFRVAGASATVTAGLIVTPGTGASGQVAMSIQGAGTGGMALQAGTTPLILGSSSGIIEIGTTGGFTANGAVATVLGSVGPPGSHTTVQKWLTITESDGSTVGWLPVF